MNANLVFINGEVITSDCLPGETGEQEPFLLLAEGGFLDDVFKPFQLNAAAANRAML